MKIKKYIYIAAAAILSSCQSEEIIRYVYSVGEADNTIQLSAGISDGHSGVMTRAGAEDHHASHLPFTANTQVRLRVDGTWTGHSPENISKTTTATIGAETGTDSKHNAVSFSNTEKLYWDDYGTADPGNSTGRNKGLDIYGVAVNGVTTAPDVSNFTALSWTLDANQSSGWASKDLLTSNNVKVGGIDGAYKFDERTSGKLLEFTHAMSKITIELTAGDGFPTTGVGATTVKFATTPEVTLQAYTTGQTELNWANTTGTVNVTTGEVSNLGTPKTITTKTNSITNTTYTVIKDALVMPGSCFGTTDEAIIAKINADGNIYYVTAAKIRAAITTKYGSGNEKNFKTQPGINYVLKVKVNKTDIEVTATIKDWETIESEEVTPVINVDADYSSSDNGTNPNFTKFSFYRSLNIDKDYSKDYSGNQNSYYAPEAVASGALDQSTKWTFNNALYWPTHSTHYHFRGVWPLTSVETTDVETNPHVKDLDSKQVIDVKNVAYQADSYPSDLAIGMPELTDANKMCKNSDHTSVDQATNGICATAGLITLNFRYMMSQVEVVLKTSDEGSSNRVNIGLNTVVEIVNVANEGYVKLGDREVVPSTQNETYTLDLVTGTGNECKRHSAIVPQTLIQGGAGAATNTRFKITVTNTDGTTDVYYADIEPILKTGTEDKVAPNGKWESGVHYKYTLKLTKTEIKVTATITDWVTVNASEDVWF